jgi:prepilin-type N-terminal cleavage/methylation domain-containing protein
MRKGFTLLELLIVAAVIGMIALVAIPNFEDAQHRSKLSRVHADLRTCAAALEAYAYDYSGAYPFDGINALDFATYNYWYLSRMLSTPVAYLPTCHMQDPFRNVKQSAFYQFRDYRYVCVEATWGDDWDSIETGGTGVSQYWDDMLAEFGGWRMQSSGPDTVWGPYTPGWPAICTQPPYNYPMISSAPVSIPYDPTNGTNSTGDIIRSHNCPSGYLNTQ